MRRFAALLLIVAPAVLSAAPRTNDIAAYRALVDQDARLATTGYRLAFANRSFCKNTAANLGFVIHDIAQYPDAETARAAFGFAQPLAVSAVVPDSPAYVAGLRAGDGLVGLSFNTWDWSGPRPKNGYDRVAKVKTDIRRRLSGVKGFALQVERKGKGATIVINPAMMCASDFQIDTVRGKDAGADGDMVSVSIGLAQYAIDQDEFAFIIAHELAHNILGHRAQIDAMKGIKTKSEIRKAILATEVDADRLSVWLMANAGYNPQGAVRFAGHCRKDSCLGLFTDAVHLGWSKRAAVLTSEIAAIQAATKTSGLVMPPLLRQN